METSIAEDLLRTETSEGVLIQIPINHRILLHDTDHLFYIEEGRIDLFGLKPQGNKVEILNNLVPALSVSTQPFMADVLEGRILFLTDIRENRFLFPFKLGGINSFICVAIATRPCKIRKIPVIKWNRKLENSDLLCTAFNAQIGHWTRDLNHILRAHKESETTPSYKLQPDTPLDVMPGNIVAIERRLGVTTYWIHLIEGDFWIGHWKNLELTSPLYFPFSPPFELCCNNRGKIMLITDFPHENPKIWFSGVKIFNENFMEQLQTVEIKKEILTEVQNKRREKSTTSVFKNTITALLNILNPKSTLQITETADPIIAAFQYLGNLQNLNFKKGNYLESDEPEVIVRRMSFASNIRFRQVNLTGKWWEEESLPMLIFYKETKSAAVLYHTHSGWILYNPTTHKEEKVGPKLASILSDEAFQFYRSFPAVRELSWKNLLSFAIKGRFFDFFLLGLIGLTGMLFGLFLPYANRIIFDDVIPHFDRVLLVEVIIGLAIATISQTLFSLTNSYVSLRLEGLISHDMQAALWDRVLNLPAKFFRNFQVGDLIQRIYGIDTIRQTLSTAMISSILNAIFSFVYLGAMFYYSLQMSIVGLIIILISILITATGSTMLYYLTSSSLTSGALLGARLLQFLFGISKIRTSAAEQRIYSSWTQEFSENSKLTYRMGLVSGGLGVVSTSFGTLSSFAIYFVVASIMESTPRGQAPSMTPGIFFAFNSAFGSFSSAIYGLTSMTSSLVTLFPLWKCTLPLRKTATELAVERIKIGNLKGQVNIEHIYFRYGRDDAYILQDVSIEAKEGEYIAIVGPSGCGKTTLLKLMIGFEDPEKGAVFYDGRNLATLDVQDLRRQMGVVLQNSSILEGTLKDNIIASGDYSDEEVQKAIQLAGFESELKLFPMGMSTMLSSGGGSLSGGQKQRIIVARSIIGRPKILIYDEATSSLDNKTQSLITKNIFEISATRIIVAHRLSTIRDADRIYVMNKGRIIEKGTYDELIKQGGLFAEMAKKQNL